jgi:peptidoglycan/xylan/chitin deacetylase (PgdA/CDA1 family)
MRKVVLVGIGLAGAAVIALLESRFDLLQQPGAGVAAVGQHESVQRPRTAVSTAPAGEKPMPPGRRDISVPIFMYHVIGDPPASSRNSELYVAEPDFAGQLEWLEAHGYTPATLRQVWDHWHGRREIPGKPVVITFDDGTRSIHARALPALSARGWVGVLNLDLSNLDPAWGLSRANVRALVEAGWEIASHSLTHRDLKGLGQETLRREVAGSREAIQTLFGEPAEFFCYPAGGFDDRIVDAVRDAGYLGATTTIYGLAHRRDPYRLARVRVERSDGVAGFVRKMTELDRG